MTASQSSSVIRGMSVSLVMPALLTTISMPPHFSARSSTSLRHGGAIGHIARMHLGRAAGRRDRVGRFLELVGTARNARHLRARRRQPQRDRLANAARCAGDDRRLATQINLYPPILFVCHVRNSKYRIYHRGHRETRRRNLEFRSYSVNSVSSVVDKCLYSIKPRCSRTALCGRCVSAVRTARGRGRFRRTA